MTYHVTRFADLAILASFPDLHDAMSRARYLVRSGHPLLHVVRASDAVVLAVVGRGTALTKVALKAAQRQNTKVMAA